MATSPKLSPFLWFDGRSEEAAEFYVSVFPNSRMLRVSVISEGPAKGEALVEFELDGQKFGAVDGGPMFSFTPAISFVISCDSQEEIDYYWDRLSEDGEPGRCGWLEDKFGLSWQVIPSVLPVLMEGNTSKLMEALLSMGKIDIEALRQAAESG
ncbi:MAG: VOC family protein [Chloroflexota bacterium]|nr:VOC family protein [Chloroflexota bacterium]